MDAGHDEVNNEAETSTREYLAVKNTEDEKRGANVLAYTASQKVLDVCKEAAVVFPVYMDMQNACHMVQATKADAVTKVFVEELITSEDSTVDELTDTNIK